MMFNFISGKSGTQRRFSFHIFNQPTTRMENQVIFNSDKAFLVDMQDIEQRLLSRFKWGLCGIAKS